MLDRWRRSTYTPDRLNKVVWNEIKTISPAWTTVSGEEPEKTNLILKYDTTQYKCFYNTRIN